MCNLAKLEAKIHKSEQKNNFVFYEGVSLVIFKANQNDYGNI